MYFFVLCYCKVFYYLVDIEYMDIPVRGEIKMINQVTSSQYSIAASTTASTNQSADQKSNSLSQADQSSKVDTIEIGTKQETSVTYSNMANKKLSADDIEALQEEANKATENLRNLVEEMILKQNKNYKTSTEDSTGVSLEDLGFTTEDVETAQEAISEDGEYGVEAVSDRLVDFAIAVSGGDKSKLSELVSAIDEGFSQAKDALGGELPDISQQTYDATMKKLDDWANGTSE